MVNTDHLRGAAITLVIVALLTGVVSGFAHWGNGDRICYDGETAVECTPEQHTAMEMVANAMGDLVRTYAAGLLVVGLVIAGVAWRRDRMEQSEQAT